MSSFLGTRNLSRFVVLALVITLAIAITSVTVQSRSASASVATTNHGTPWSGEAGVTVLCSPTASYACVDSAYATWVKNPTGWAATLYYGTGCPSSASCYPSFNSYGPHNCTLYAAFELQKNGLASPGWSDNADNWATRAANHGVTVNQTPGVGSVAQWNSPSTDGHVAYVYNVTSSYIDITADNFYDGSSSSVPAGGWTDSYQIALNSPAMPDNFIHFGDASAPQPSSQNLLSNGSWGTGQFAPWTGISVNGGTTNYGAYSNSSIAQEGTTYAASNTSTRGGSIYQDVPASSSPGQSYTFSIWVKSSTSIPVSGMLSLLALGGTADNDLTDFTVGNTWTLVSAPLSITQSGHTDLRAQVYETTTGTTYYFDGGTLVSGSDQASSTGVVVTTTTTTTLPGATTTSVPGTTTATVAVEGNLKTAGVTVLFVSGESTLKSAAKSTLATLSKKLTSGASIIFTGYAKNNTALAKGRAEAVRNYLSSKVKIRFVLRMVTSSPANKVTVITTKN